MFVSIVARKRLLAAASTAALSVVIGVVAQQRARGDGTQSGGAQADAASSTSSVQPSIINAITQPSERHKLSFPAAGIVKTEMVKEGDPVKTGEGLLAQDDELELAEMAKAKVDAESTAKVDAAIADYNAKKHVYVRKLDTYKKGGANLQEVEDAELDMILRDKQINVAKDDQQQAKIKYEQEQAKVRDMHLDSPVDGYVERIMVQSGEMADPQKPDGAVWVVKNNPLFIEIRDLSSRQANNLHLGDKLKVKYPEDSQWQTATVSFRSPVVDAASDTQLVKLTLDNASGRDAGLQVQVQLPAAGSTGNAGTANDSSALKSTASANP